MKFHAYKSNDMHISMLIWDLRISLSLSLSIHYHIWFIVSNFRVILAKKQQQQLREVEVHNFRDGSQHNTNGLRN
jgi:hypothetical protein